MTRETKIGLLVGLAFIIVIGILLSDFSSNELPQAALNNTGNSVREGVTAPAPAVEADAPSNVNVVIQRVTPRQQVLTPRELSPQAAPQGAPTESISVGPSGSSSPITIHNVPAQTPAAPQQIVQNSNPPAPVAPNAQADSNIPEALQRIANQQNETLVSTGSHPDAAASANAPGTQKHVAEPGDNLSRLAAKYMGNSGKAARDAIVKANPSLAADPNKIIVGHTYIIPAPLPAAAAPTAPAVAVATTRPAAAPAPAVAPTNTVWYTVKEGDNLWSIAAAQLGSGPAYTAIKELNQDVLKGKENVVVNMRLRLPASRPIASAQ